MPKKLKRISNLKLVASPASKKLTIRDIKPRNFWNSCPLQLEFLPTRCCSKGKAASNCKSDFNTPCDWAINSEKHNYCFWKWVQENSSPEGQMIPLRQNEAATFLGCSSTKIHFIEKAAISKLKKSSHAPQLASYLKEMSKISDKYEHSPQIEASVAKGLKEND